MKIKNGMTLWILLVSLLFALAGCGGGGGGSSAGGGGTDTAAPTAPSALVAAVASSSSISLNWTASTDDVGVVGYKIYRGGTQVNTSATNSFSDSGLTASTNYSYTVAAYDAAGNTSTQSTSASATTLAAGGGSATSGANFKMPDTNQTASYTTTFGEDHDYTINPPSYTDNGNGTITDNVTGLIWQKQDDAITRTWDDATTYCDNLTLGSQTDWRLPSRIELISIVDYGSYNPAINTTYFPNTISSEYWSSTTYVGSTAEAWYVYFGQGYSSVKTGLNYVRCVH